VISSFSAVSSTVLVSCFKKPVRAGQRQALLRARRTSSLAAASSAVGSGLSFFAVTPSSIAVITSPRRAIKPGVIGRKTVRSTVPQPRSHLSRGSLRR